MGTEAKGQLFGYTLQYPRALLRLIEIPNDAFVSVEEFSDVGVIYSDNSKLAEEDKSSISGQNLLFDMSTNLWKSFFNWVNAVKNGKLDVERDKFVLYANFIPKNDSLVFTLNKANVSDVDLVLTNIKSSLKNIFEKPNHIIYKYVTFLFDEANIEIFKKLILKFEFIADKSADNVYQNIEIALRHDLMFDEAQDVHFVLDSLTGWLQRIISERIARHESAIVARTEMIKYIAPTIQKLRDKTLIDYALSKMPTRYEAEKSIVEKQPVYVKQLVLINSETDEIIDAVLDYYKADTNRLNWIEKGLVSLDDITSFKNELYIVHRNEKKKIKITQPNLPPEEQGHLLLLNCQEKQIKLANQEPPSGTIAGSYHVLSDEQLLGWHPDWKNKLQQMEVKENG